MIIILSGGSRPGHKVSGTQSKFPNLNENGQKSHFFCEVFLTQNLVNILSRSATNSEDNSIRKRLSFIVFLCLLNLLTQSEHDKLGVLIAF